MKQRQQQLILKAIFCCGLFQPGSSRLGQKGAVDKETQLAAWLAVLTRV